MRYSIFSTAIIVCLASGGGQARTVDVKYRGFVALTPFECQEIKKSSFIHELCFDQRNMYMLINIRGSWFHYCAIDRSIVSAFLGADSMGRFFNNKIKGSFDCRVNKVPVY